MKDWYVALEAGTAGEKERYKREADTVKGGKRKVIFLKKRPEERKITERIDQRCRAVFAVLLIVSLSFVLLSGCSESAEFSAEERFSVSEADLGGLEIAGSMELSYASEFSVDYLSNGGRLIRISDGSCFLMLPEGTERPEGLADEITVLQGPVNRIYLAASAAMDHFCKMGAMDAVTLTGTKSSGWYIEEVRDAMEEERLLYAGKYNMPDYELILREKCALAVESTMIFHTPEVKEQLEDSGIPVLVDYSSYEQHPLGRSEWIKLYGVLTGHEQEAEAAFQKQADQMETAVRLAKTEPGEGEKTTAFFYITSNGAVNVRKSGDYVSKMIELAGGRYIFDDLGSDDGKATTTVTIQMEDFYAAAREADYLIYNSTVGGELKTIDQLLGKSELLEDFKAVKSGNVYCTGKNMYQETSEAGTMVYDLYQMFSGKEDGMQFLYRLE